MDRIAAEAEERAQADASANGTRVAAPLPARGVDIGVLRRAGATGGSELLNHLQRGAGNRAVGALLQRCGCDATCACGTHAHDEHQAAEDERLSHAVLQLKARLSDSLPEPGAVRRGVDRSLGGHMATLQREEGDETAGAAALQAAPLPGGGGGTPTFNHSVTTATINADTAADFSNRITAQIGSPHTKIEVISDVQYDFTTNANGDEIPSTRKITSVSLTVNTEIVKVRYGGGRPNDKNKKAIDEMVATIEAHENQHQAIVVAEANAAMKKAQKLVGTKKVKEAYQILDGVDCAASKKHEALDAKEGLLTAVEQSNGDVTITKSASGAKYPCKPAGGGKSP